MTATTSSWTTCETLTDAEAPGVNQGMGVFTFRPDAMRKYELKIDAPLGMTGKHELPEAKTDGVALKSSTA